MDIIFWLLIYSLLKKSIQAGVRSGRAMNRELAPYDLKLRDFVICSVVSPIDAFSFTLGYRTYNLGGRYSSSARAHINLVDSDVCDQGCMNFKVKGTQMDVIQERCMS